MNKEQLYWQMRENDFIKAINNKDLEVVREYIIEKLLDNRIYGVKICDSIVKSMFPSFYQPMSEKEKEYFDDESFDKCAANGDFIIDDEPPTDD